MKKRTRKTATARKSTSKKKKAAKKKPAQKTASRKKKPAVRKKPAASKRKAPAKKRTASTREKRRPASKSIRRSTAAAKGPTLLEMAQAALDGFDAGDLSKVRRNLWHLVEALSRS